MTCNIAANSVDVQAAARPVCRPDKIGQKNLGQHNLQCHDAGVKSPY